MLKKSWLSTLSSLTFFVGCDAITEKNFKKAIEDYINEQHYPDIRVCLPENAFVGINVKQAAREFYDIISNERFKALPQEEQNRQTNFFSKFVEGARGKADNDYVFMEVNSPQEEIQTLINAGMLTSINVTADKSLYFTTEKSRNNVCCHKNDKDKKFFCTEGKYVVDEIIEFTKPCDLLGELRTNVTYTIKAKFKDNWANAKEIQRVFKTVFYEIPKIYYTAKYPYAKYDGKPFSIWLVQTNKGWKVP